MEKEWFSNDFQSPTGESLALPRDTPGTFQELPGAPRTSQIIPRDAQGPTRDVQVHRRIPKDRAKTTKDTKTEGTSHPSHQTSSLQALVASAESRSAYNSIKGWGYIISMHGASDSPSQSVSSPVSGRRSKRCLINGAQHTNSYCGETILRTDLGSSVLIAKALK